jgi:hypothetical protein
VTSTQQNAFPTALWAGGASYAALGFLCGGASCATWMRPDGDASCAAVGERTEGSASCTTLWSGIRNGGASCATLLLLSDAHRLSGLRTRTDRRGPSGGTRRLFPSMLLSGDGRAGCPLSHSRSGECPIRCTFSTPRRSPMWKSAINEDSKDDEHKYHAPYLVRRCHVVVHGHRATHPLGCLASGADETPSSPRITHRTHNNFYPGSGRERGSRVKPYIQLV